MRLLGEYNGKLIVKLVLRKGERLSIVPPKLWHWWDMSQKFEKKVGRWGIISGIYKYAAIRRVIKSVFENKEL